MIKNNWILCPICGNKTRVKVRENTILENFPPVLVRSEPHPDCWTGVIHVR
ncbi:cysteine-rich KTR domain-containing protein [Bifidobacterium catenulatum subsp. kashiwanohense]|uniref:Cysteine-rich KTR domain-containing protein n=1 Tax=Bifidobacterium catenulatum subsp. kashiwanohense TaxID=630129 RepID=A0AAJ1UNE5_9BIFI|nr:cysteine-rich KTR domain-containing protein [Bifidobacterium catenulatum]MDH7899863.1 cysteine-rich KTR domain-containing protein [Bifidobacterium catenulatum subsp. kashiwanohense]